MYNAPMSSITLKKSKEIPILAGHPWIFSNAIEQASISEKVCVVEVLANDGKSLGMGTYNEASSIRVRMLTREKASIDRDFFLNRLRLLKARKEAFLPKNSNAYRLAQADADWLPGLIVDIFHDVLVFQIHTAGMELFRNILIDAFAVIFKPRVIVERSDVEARRADGLKVLKPIVHTGEISGPVSFKENGLVFHADVIAGQKTGFFLDQRDMRAAVAKHAAGKHILNLFGYTGAFSVYAAVAGAASTTTVEASEPALLLAEKNFAANGITQDDRHSLIEGDVFDYLAHGEIACGKFDIIICDPPAFAKSGDKIQQALKAYLNLNKRCLSLLAPGGLLLSSSCSGRITAEAFLDTLRHAAGQAGKDAAIAGLFGQPEDHTDRIAFPEGRYLKTVFLRVL